MKICERMIHSLQIYNSNGDVRLCGWRKTGYGGTIGSLKDASLYEIWHGEAANKARAEVAAGDYSDCIIDSCPYLSQGSIEEHRIELDKIPEYPEHLWLAYDHNCNYACPVCDQNHNEGRLEDSYNMIYEKVKDVLPHLKFISANGLGELFVSKSMLKILSEWKPLAPKEECSVHLETNGSLFDEKHWKQIENLGQYHLGVAITVMSFDEKTYQICSGMKLPVSRIENSLAFVKKLRDQGIINYLELCTVVQERNFRTLPELTRRFIEEFGADVVRLRPFLPLGVQSPETEWFTDVRGAHHPYHKEYLEVMKDPIFKHPKVNDWSGGRDSQTPDLKTYLANHGWPIGRTDALPQCTPVPLDAGKDKANYEVIKVFAVEEKMPAKLAKYFLLHRIQKVAVYGLSFVAHAFLEALSKTDVEVERIIDKRLCGCPSHGLTISCVGDLPQDYTLPIIVTAPFYFEEIKKEIEARVPYPCIINIKDIVAEVGCSIV